MRKQLLITFLLSLLICYASSAQSKKSDKAKMKIGVSYSTFGDNDIIRFSGELDGSASNLGDRFYTLGIIYIHPVKKWLEWETGIEYSRQTFRRIIDQAPSQPQINYLTSFSVIDVPITLRFNFLKYFFINSGIMINFDANTSYEFDTQTGIGAILGIAAKYDFGFGGSIFVNPYAKAYTLLPFSPEENQQRLMENGVRIGFTYSF